MKKIITFALALTLATTINAENITVFSCGLGTPGVEEPQLMGLGLSPNGRYVCGSIENGMGIFAADVQTGEVKWNIVEADDGGELRHIDNNGLAIGVTDVGITYDFTTGEETVIQAPEGYKYFLGEALTDDGSMLVGSLISDALTTYPAYKKEGGDWTLLPIPSEEEQGPFAHSAGGGAAKYVSGDGKVIFGCLGSFTIPVVWVMNENGEFEYDFFAPRYVKTEETDVEDESKPLYALSASYLSLSNNGRYVSMVGLVMNEELEDYLSVPVIYDVLNKEIKIYDGLQSIDENSVGLYPTAICDSGSFIGTIGQPYFESYGTFIMKNGQTTPETFNEAFPLYEEKFGVADSFGFNIPTGYSADGRYIMGYIFYSDDFADPATDAYYVTYVLDRGEGASVEAIDSDKTEAVPESFYTIDGQRLIKPTKGLNIIRMSDGTSRKVLVR